MSNLSIDSENDSLSGEVDIIGLSSTDSLDSNDWTEDMVEQVARTLDYLLDVFDIPTLRRLVAAISYVRKDVGLLRQNLQMGLTTWPNCSFLEELNGSSAPTQLPQVLDLTAGEDAAFVRTTGQASTSGQKETSEERSGRSRSTAPLGEPVQTR